MVKLVLIDLDDTLWDTQTNNRESLYELYTALGWGQYFVSFEAFFDVYEPINLSLWSQYALGQIDARSLSIERLRRPLAPFLELGDSMWEQYDEQFMELIRHKRRLCPGAMDALEYLHGRYRICILSNGFGSVQYAKIEHSGLSPYIDAVVLSEEVGYRKPDERIYIHALSRMNVRHDESVMVGDSWLADIVGASNAAIPSIWYNPHALHPLTTDCTPPKHTIAHLSELCQLL